MTQQEINELLEKPFFEKVIQEQEFYFLKGQQALQVWLDLKVSEKMKEDLIRLSSDYSQFLEVAQISPEHEKIGDLIFEIIAYCDNRAKEKSKYNRYEDDRILADASVRMGNWVDGLIRFKFNHQEIKGLSILNALNYLLRPQENITILSDNYREMISQNLLKREYKRDRFVEYLKNYFDPFKIKPKNAANYTFLVANILYTFESEWNEDVVGLMASDGTGWHEANLFQLGKYDGMVTWNSKKPSGGDKVLKMLRSKIRDGESFPLFYSSKKNVRYKANIVDFATNQNEYLEKDWGSKNIKYYQTNFSDHKDSNKSAKIVFLADSLEKIDAIPVEQFAFFGKYMAPTQDNLAPIKEIPIFKSLVVDQEEKNQSMNGRPSLNQILFGPPGTGKTYHTVDEALRIVGVNTEDLTRTKIKEAFDSKVREGQIVFTTFHQSMCYEDFIEGIKPIEPEKDGGQVIYRVEPGIFKKLCQNAATPNFRSFEDTYQALLKELTSKDEIIELTTPTGKKFGVSANSKGNLSLHTGKEKTVQGTLTKENLQKQISGEDKFIGWEGYFKGVLNLLRTKYGFKPEAESESKNYVLIIDEINRGNVSQIFGELITLIEEDKRLGRDEALEVTLPYSKEKFGVPVNLYLIGTMNTADRSVESLDTALRRRFSFTEMPPKYDLKELDYKVIDTTGNKILEKINRRIEKLLDRDHLIGHSYFMKKEGMDPLEQLRESFYRSIIPLLQEYFFGDYAKIGAVLGQGFVRVKNGNDKDQDTLFAPFEGFEAADFQDKLTFEIIYYPDLNSTQTMLMDKVSKEITFEKAIRLLMNQPID